MEVNVKFQGIDSTGKIVEFIKSFECPEFEKKYTTLDKYDFTTTVDEQVKDWLQELDKTEIMYENDIYIILDWIIQNEDLKSDKDIVLDFINSLDEKIKYDIEATYTKMYDSIKDLNYQQQLDIVMSTTSIGYQAVIQSFDRIEARSKNKNKKRIDDNNNIKLYLN